jgi:uncharacterized protein YndB with AHSA1/START domain
VQEAAQLGVVGGDADSRFVRFERTLSAPPDRVWRALTEPSELAGWLADATVELRVGGAIALTFDDGRVTGTITELDPGRVLGYSWRERAGEAHVRFVLKPVEGGGTALTLVHTHLAAASADGFAAGWHHHLELLEAAACGNPIAWSWDRFRELKERYVERDAATSARNSTISRVSSWG